MALMQLTVVPMAAGSLSISDFVADFQDELARLNVTYTLTDMGTIVEGDAEDLLHVAAQIHQLPFKKGIQRVLTHITIDDRRDKTVHLGDKIQSVKQKIRG